MSDRACKRGGGRAGGGRAGGGRAGGSRRECLMPIYLCGQSALEMWRYLRAAESPDPQSHNVCRKSAITDPVHTKHQFRALSSETQDLLYAIPWPCHVLVKSHADRRESRMFKPRVWSRPLPRGTFVELNEELYLSSGPFLMLQLANELDFVRAVRVGLELCGIYTLYMGEKIGLKSTDPSEKIYKFISGVPPVTSVAKIERFLEGCHGQMGHREADKVLKYLLDDSGSPMESAAYMLACMPKRYGGYGVHKPAFNPTVNVQTKSGLEQRRPDLFWAGPGVDVEYNSDLIHIAKEQYYKDAKRQVELVAARYQVLPLTRDDVMSPVKFDKFMFGLAKVLGIRMRAFPADWRARRKALRKGVFAWR